MKNFLFIFIGLIFGSHLLAQDNQKINSAIFPDIALKAPNPPKPIKGWELAENWKATDGIALSEDLKNASVLVGKYPGKIIKFQFKGNAVGIETVAIPDAGIIEYSIDGSDWQMKDLFYPLNTEKHIPLYFTLGKNLKNRRHTLQIRLTDERNSESSGNKCVISHFYFNAPE